MLMRRKIQRLSKGGEATWNRVRLPMETDDENAAFKLALSFEEELRRLLFRYSRSDSDTEDLLQDT
jgi:DNA-directed RNA polymerase specialized sigma24 family protein